MILSRGALVQQTLVDLELGAVRGLSTSTDLKAVLAEKIPAEQVGFLLILFPSMRETLVLTYLTQPLPPFIKTP